MEIRLIGNYRDFKDLKPLWNSLLEGSKAKSIFMTHEWIDTWWEFYGSGNQLMILAANDSKGQIAAIAPLMIRQRVINNLPARSVELIGSGEEITPDHLGFIAASGVKNEFARAVFAYLGSVSRLWDVIRLTDADEGAFILPDMILGATLPRLNVIQALGVCPFIRLPATWEEYTAGLSGELRYSIKRKMKTVEKQFSPRFEICGDISKIDGIMEKLRELHCGRMAEKKLTGASLEANFWEFHKRIAKVMLPLGRLVLGTLTINDSIVGCQYAFQYSGAMCYYQSGIDTAYSKYSIGLLLTALMIKEAIKMGLGEYDFLRGDESYKFHWTKEFRNNTEISMWNGTLKSQVLRGLFSAKQYAKSLVNKYLQPAGANYAAAVEAHGARRA